MENQANILRVKLSNLSYNDIRKEAKINFICARGKKTELIEKIIEIRIKKLKENTGTNNFTSEGDNKLNENDLVLEEKQNSILLNETKNKEESLNSTFTVESHPDEDFLSDDNEVNENDGLKQNNSPVKEISFISEDVSLHMDTSVKSNNSTVNKEGEVELETYAHLSELENNSTNNQKNNNKEFSSKLKTPVTVMSRFKKQHEKLFKNMPSICNQKKILKDRFEKNNSLLSERMKQLASPKHIKKQNEVKTFSPPSDISNLSFKFGNVPISDYPNVQKNQSTPYKTVERKSIRRSLHRLVEKKINVKQITMSASRSTSRLPIRNIRKATTPVLSARLEQLATPKGRRISLTNEEVVSKSLGKKSYTPYTGRFDYVDTTQMNDMECNEYIKSQGK